MAEREDNPYKPYRGYGSQGPTVQTVSGALPKATPRDGSDRPRMRQGGGILAGGAVAAPTPSPIQPGPVLKPELFTLPRTPGPVPMSQPGPRPAQAQRPAFIPPSGPPPQMDLRAEAPRAPGGRPIPLPHLDTVVAEAPGPAVVAPLAATGPKPAQRRGWLLPTAALIALTVIAAIAVSFFAREAPPAAVIVDSSTPPPAAAAESTAEPPVSAPEPDIEADPTPAAAAAPAAAAPPRSAPPSASPIARTTSRPPAAREALPEPTIATPPRLADEPAPAPPPAPPLVIQPAPQPTIPPAALDPGAPMTTRPTDLPE